MKARCSKTVLLTSSRTSWSSCFFASMLNRNSPITRPPFPSSYPKTAHQDDPTFNLAFQGIHPSIYRSSSTQAFVVAMRFWLWKLHTTLQLGSGESCIADGRIPGLLKPDLATWLAILEIRKLCDDIWVVKTGKLVGNKRNIALQSGSPSTSALDERSTFLVLSINGEVISRSSDLDDVEAREESEIEGCYVRTDWRKLILARTSDTMANTFSKKTSSHGHINDFIRTKDVHEFPRGVSRAWRDRMENVDKCRMAEAINVADRSAVSSCVLQRYASRATVCIGAILNSYVVSTVRSSAQPRWTRIGSAGLAENSMWIKIRRSSCICLSERFQS